MVAPTKDGTRLGGGGGAAAVVGVAVGADRTTGPATIGPVEGVRATPITGALMTRGGARCGGGGGADIIRHLRPVKIEK